MTPERRDEITLRVVSVVVVGSLALALAGLTWRLVRWDDGRSEVAVAESLAPLGAAAAPGADADVARIVSLAPFGGAAAPGGLPSASTLGLVLKGVIMAYPASASTALISVGEGPATIYGIGQTPVGDAVIEQIEVDYVILTSGGTRQRLDFPMPVVADPAAGTPTTPGAGITVTPATPAAPPAPGAPLTSAPLTSAPSGTAPSGTAAAPAVNAAAAAGAGVTATAAGYRIGPNPSAEIRRFGLQPGDVIESLNGEAVGNAGLDASLIQRARSAGQARVVILREGRRLTVNLPLR